MVSEGPGDDRRGRDRNPGEALYDLRSTFASNALARRITMFELARIMGTSAKMIEAHYGRSTPHTTRSSRGLKGLGHERGTEYAAQCSKRRGT